MLWIFPLSLTLLSQSCRSPLVGPADPAGPNQDVVSYVDTTSLPPGLSLLAHTLPLTEGRQFAGNVLANDKAVYVRSATSGDRILQSRLLVIDTINLEVQNFSPVTESVSNTLFDRDALQVTDDYVFLSGPYQSEGRIATSNIPSWTINIGDAVGRSFLHPNKHAYASHQYDISSVSLIDIDMSSGDTTTLHTYSAIDSTWSQELSGFTAFEPRGGGNFLIYFLRSYSEALKDPTFRLCGYDLDADTALFEFRPEDLGLRVDQSSNTYGASVHGDLILLLTGHQYVGFDPVKREVRYIHNEVGGRRIYANSGQFEPNNNGIVVVPSNGAAPTAGINVATGEILWHNASIEPNGRHSHPVGEDHIAYVSVSGRLYLIEAATGRIVWKMKSPLVVPRRGEIPFANTFFVVRGNRIYIHDRYRVYAFEVDIE